MPLRPVKTRFRWRGATSSSGATILVRPEGPRRINRPSEVIPTKRLRTGPRRPRDELLELRSPRARLAAEATDFFSSWGLDWLAVAGGGSLLASDDEFAAMSAEGELSSVGAAEFCTESVGADASA